MSVLVQRIIQFNSRFPWLETLFFFFFFLGGWGKTTQVRRKMLECISALLQLSPVWSGNILQKLSSHLKYLDLISEI